MKQKIYKLCSILLTIAMILSACVCTTIGTVAAEGQSVTYYAGPLGDDSDGTTPEKAFLTINQAVVAANEAGYGAGDTVSVKVLRDVADNYAQWGTDTLTAHEFTLKLSSYNEDIATIYRNGHFRFGGPVSFENIKISGAANAGQYLSFRDADVITVGPNVTVQNYDILLGGVNFTTAKSINLIDGNFGDTFVIGGRNDTHTLAEDCDVIVNNELSNTLMVGTKQSGMTTFNKNLNIELQRHTGTTLTKGAATFASGAALQVVNARPNYAGTLAADAAAITSQYYLLQSYIYENGSLHHTDKAGVFDLTINDSERYSVTVKKGETVVYENLTGGKVDLTDSGYGEYTFELADKYVGATTTYYVSPNGVDTNDGTTSGTALATIAKAVELANVENYGEYDTVKVKVIDVVDARSLWGEPLGTYPFKLHIMSEESNSNKPWIQFSDNMELGGKTVLDGVVIVNGNANYKTFDIQGNDVEFINGTYFSGSNVDFTLYDSYTDRTDDINAYFGSAMGKTLALGGNYVSHDMNANITLTYENTGNNSIQFGSTKADSIPVYMKNINLNIKSANKFTIYTGSNYKFAPGSAVQFINSSGLNLTDAKNVVSALTDTQSNPVPYYILNVDERAKDDVKFTATAGKFDISGIDTNIYTVSLKKDGVTIAQNITSDILDLTKQGYGSDSYTLELKKKNPTTKTLYVSSSGSDSNTGESTSSPLLTIDGAIQKANLSQYGPEDTVYIKLIDNAARYSWYNSSSDSAKKYLNKNVKWQCKLHISSSNGRASISDVSTGVRFLGPVHLENLWFPDEISQTIGFYADGDVTIGEKVVFNLDRSTLFMWYQDSASKNIQILSDIENEIILGNRNERNTQIDGDINLTIDNTITNKITIGDPGANSGSMTKYNANINFNIKNAGGFNFRTDAKYTFSTNSAIQAINSSGNTFSTLASTFSNYTNSASESVPYYILNTPTTAEDKVLFTNTAGKFALSGIDTSVYNVVVKKNGTVVAENLTDYVDLTQEGSGEYTLELQEKSGGGETTTSKTTTYYIAPSAKGGSDSNNGTTYSTPVLTVKKAIELAVAADYKKGDTVNLKVLYDADTNNDWGATLLPEYEFTLHISSADSTTAWIGLGNGADVSLNGPTILDNVIAYVTNYKAFNFNANDVEFRNGAQIRGNFDATAYDSYTAYTSDEWFNINLLSDFTNGSPNKLYLAGNYKNCTIDTTYHIVLDNTDANTIVVGNHNGNDIPTFKKPIIVEIKNSGDFSLGTYINGTGRNCVEFGPDAAIQIVNYAGVDLTKTKSNLNEYATTLTSVPDNYIVYADSALKGQLQSDGAGQFNILNNKKVAVRDLSNDNLTICTNEISLEPNKEYQFTLISGYANLGDRIIVESASTINLANEAHTEKDGKLFIGWKKDTGAWASLNGNYKSGDILTAEYIDFTKDSFAINNFDINSSSSTTFTFGYKNTQSVIDIPNVSEKGVIWAKTDTVKGRELHADKEVVTDWTWDSTDKNNFTAKSTLAAPSKVLNKNVTTISLAESDYNTYYTAKAYIKYTDRNGISGTLYTTQTTFSAYKAAVESDTPKDIHRTIIAKVKNSNKSYVSGISETVVNTYDKNNSAYKRNTNSYDVFSNISGAGDYISRKRTTYLTNTGIKETINLGWLTDLHLYNVSQRDVDEQVLPLLAMFRGSYGWMSSGESTLNRAISQVNYAVRRYNKTIVTGDSIEAAGYGMFNTMKNLIGDKGVNGGVLMTTGNHEFFNYTNADVDGLSPYFSVEDKYEQLDKHFPNDPTYYSEILKTYNGEDNAMLILLDNARDSGLYCEGTAAKLQASIDIAKSKNIPVIIFQHVAMSTYNSTETKVYYGAPESMEIPTETTGKGYYNLSNYNNKSANTEVYNIIRKNSDVILGIFGGHEHSNMYAEVTALDDSGNIIPDKYIPMFLAADGKNQWVNEIILEADNMTFTENFNDMTTAEGLDKWIVDDASTITDGRLNLSSSLMSDKITSKNQYMSINVKGSDLANGVEIRSRVGSSKYYSLKASGSTLAITKTGSNLTSGTLAIDTNKLYRLSISVVSSGSNAVIKAYLHDYTDGNAVQTLTYTDTSSVLSGKEFGIVKGSAKVSVDNFYFSNSRFRDNDVLGWITGDVNGDRLLDIRDLVFADENKTSNEAHIFARTDKDANNKIEVSDFKAICKIIVDKIAG